MKELIKKLEMKVKDCYNTNTIFDKRKYVLLSDAKKVVNEALGLHNVVEQSEQLPCDRCEGKPENECVSLCYDCEVDLNGM